MTFITWISNSGAKKCLFLPLPSKWDPFYLYSYQTLKNHFRVFDQAFAEIPHRICFAAKSNANIAILRIFILEGGGVDIVSGVSFIAP